MIKIDLPSNCQNYADVIDSCCNIMRDDNTLKSKIKENKNDLLRVSEYYKHTAKTNHLFFHQYYKCEENCHIIITNKNINTVLTKHDMIKLYDEYFVKKRNDNNNHYYDTIINNAKDPTIYCPFCCGIGTPTEIDHFLPKSQCCYYSIFPYNLIPICKDCNQIYKKDFFPEYEKQLIHPYLDDNCFFNDQWLYAEYINIPNDIGTIKYFVKPPNHWSIDKKNKVEFHFNRFNLAERFFKKSCSPLSHELNSMKAYKKSGISMNDFEQCSIDSYLSEESRINHWKRALYQAIKNSISTIWQNI
ncbi:hypothetical protein P375_12145 [Gallibacterium genomosp. 2]|uniref:HNH endonuclease n=1 Tax=Gallibacterium genomosp. 2 TaxID=155517 RepID=A0A0A2XWY1_9PAST|nr:hypothetical protein [Gallibacterium genomosp. 2]KGQ29629.1 hypothetical protein P375_12145 [Gallibacterium genomosp. 2]